MDSQRVASLSRILCSSSRDCNQVALLEALVKGINLQEGASLNLVSPATLQFENQEQYDSPIINQEDGQLGLLKLMQRDQMLRRETRSALDGELLRGDDLPTSSSSSNLGGAKRVAFTPRIG